MRRTEHPLLIQMLKFKRMTTKQLEKRIAYLEMVMGINTQLVVTVQDIVKAVCQVYDVSLIELKIKNRSRKYVEPRKMLCFLADYYRVVGCVEMGKILDRDHTSIIHLRNTARDLINVNDEGVIPYFLKCKQILEP